MFINWKCIWGKIQGASDAVEYVSWVSASIFAVLAIFSIFLAYQFQTNATDSRKMIWKMRETARTNNADEFLAAREEFIFLQTKLEYVTNSIQIVKDIISYLIYIWIVCGITMLAKQTYTTESGFNPIRLFLILSITIIFVHFALALIKIIDQLATSTENGNENYKVENITDLETLNSYNWNPKNIISIMDPSLEFIITGEEPFAQIYIKQKVIFKQFGILLSIVSDDSNLYVGVCISDQNKKNIYDLGITNLTDLELVNRFMTEFKYHGADICLSILIGDSYHHYKVNTTRENEVDFEKVIFGLDTLIVNSWVPPKGILDLFKDDNELLLIK